VAADVILTGCILDNLRKVFLFFFKLQTVQCIIFTVITLQASYPCAFTQRVPNITLNRPPQHPVPTPCTLHNSSVSTFLPTDCFLQCHMKCIVVNLNIYSIISSILKLCYVICVLWDTFNLTPLCPSLSVCLLSVLPDSTLHVTAYVDVTELHCLSNITVLFHN
jgi:hypothetical protein